MQAAQQVSRSPLRLRIAVIQQTKQCWTDMHIYLSRHKTHMQNGTPEAACIRSEFSEHTLQAKGVGHTANHEVHARACQHMRRVWNEQVVQQCRIFLPYATHVHPCAAC